MPSSRAGPGGKEAETERAKGDRSGGVAAVTSTSSVPAPAPAQAQPPRTTCALVARRALYRVEDLEDVYGGIFFGGAADLAPY